MRIADAIEEFIRGNDWDDELEKDEENGKSSVTSPFLICNQIFEMVVEGDEVGEKLSTPWQMKHARAPITRPVHRAHNGKTNEPIRNALAGRRLQSGALPNRRMRSNINIPSNRSRALWQQ